MMGFCGDMIDIAKSITEDPKIIKYTGCPQKNVPIVFWQ